jgi:hypothetical protein
VQLHTHIRSITRTTITIIAQHWAATLKSCSARGDDAKAERYKQLAARIFAWREQAAVKESMSPASILPDHLIYRIAYSQCADVDGLRACGVRFVRVAELAATIQTALTELKFPVTNAADAIGGGGGDDGGGAPIVLPAGVWRAPGGRAWKHFSSMRCMGQTTKSGKSKAKNWEVSESRFAKGDAVTTIAMDQVRIAHKSS